MNEFHEVMAEAAPNLLKLEAAKHADVGVYCERLIGLYCGLKLLHFLDEIAQTVEPVDRVLGYDEDLPSANAFLAGAVLGLRVVKQFVPTDVQRKMSNYYVADDAEEEDWDHRVHQVASSVISTSEQGFSLVPHMEELIDDWSAQAVPEVRHQPYFRRGFGLVMYMMNQAYEDENQANEDKTVSDQMVIADRDGVDWDKEFENFFGSDDHPKLD